MNADRSMELAALAPDRPVIPVVRAEMVVDGVDHFVVCAAARCP